LAQELILYIIYAIISTSVVLNNIFEDGIMKEKHWALLLVCMIIVGYIIIAVLSYKPIQTELDYTDKIHVCATQNMSPPVHILYRDMDSIASKPLVLDKSIDSHMSCSNDISFNLEPGKMKILRFFLPEGFKEELLVIHIDNVEYREVMLSGEERERTLIVSNEANMETIHK